MKRVLEDKEWGQSTPAVTALSKGFVQTSLSLGSLLSQVHPAYNFCTFSTLIESKQTNKQTPKNPKCSSLDSY